MTDLNAYTNEIASDDAEPVTPLEEAADEDVETEQEIAVAAQTPGPVKVFDAHSASEGEIVRGLLEAEGIDAVFESLPGLSMTDNVILGETFHGAVLVPASEAGRAKELIDAYASSPVTDADVDGSAGQPI